MLTSSCSDTEGPIGIWDDNIKLSQKGVQFTAEKSSTLITTEGESWWIDGISLNGSSNLAIREIDTSAKNFVLDEAEFRIERKNGTEIHVEMTENMTGVERILIIGLSAGNYSDGIRISQSAN
jgi:hypothetical protein